MELSFLILSSVVFFVFLFHRLRLRLKTTLPPGPAGLPVIGNLLDLGPKPHESLANLARKHGPLMTIQLGVITNVVVSTPDAAREVLQLNDEACSGRPLPDAIAALDGHDAIVLWNSPNKEWRSLKKALNTYLTHEHKLDTFRDLRQNVVAGMLDFLRDSGRRNYAVDVGKLAFSVALNQMSNTCISRDLTGYVSDDVGGFKEALRRLIVVNGKFNVADFFPVVKALDPQKIRRRATAAFGWLDKAAAGFISERMKDRESGLPRFDDILDSLLDYSRDNEADFNVKHVRILLLVNHVFFLFILLKIYHCREVAAAGFISERMKDRESGLPRFDDILDSLLDYSRDNEADFNVKHVRILLLELFLAGTEMSSSTIEWAMTELLLNPEMFLKVREEVSKIVGEDGKVQESKTLDLPYLQAVIKETMRLHPSVPLLAPHKTQVEVKLGEYIVPKNTQILVNAWAIARDPMYWENPLVFMPERFLGNKLDYKGRHFEFIPFGSGRRMCPGIPLAHRVVSHMVASLVYHFDWELPHPEKEMDMNDFFGLTLLKATPLVATPVPRK